MGYAVKRYRQHARHAQVIGNEHERLFITEGNTVVTRQSVTTGGSGQQNGVVNNAADRRNVRRFEDSWRGRRWWQTPVALAAASESCDPSPANGAVRQANTRITGVSRRGITNVNRMKTRFE